MNSAYQSLRALNRALTRSVPIISKEAHLRIHGLWQAAAHHLVQRQPSMALAAIELGWDTLHRELEWDFERTGVRK